MQKQVIIQLIPPFLWDPMCLNSVNFGFRKNCRTVFTEELKTHKVLASSPEIKAPKILVSGKLSEDWSYLVFNKAEGQSLHHSPLSYEDKLRLAVDLGSELKRVHGLKCDWYFDKKFWQELNLVEAAKKVFFHRT